MIRNVTRKSSAKAGLQSTPPRRPHPFGVFGRAREGLKPFVPSRLVHENILHRHGDEYRQLILFGMPASDQALENVLHERLAILDAVDWILFPRVLPVKFNDELIIIRHDSPEILEAEFNHRRVGGDPRLDGDWFLYHVFLLAISRAVRNQKVYRSPPCSPVRR